MTKLQVTVENNFVHFFETEANRKETELTIKFHRTLRVPDDGKIYPLPPSLGVFPVCKVDDYLDKVPDSWKKQGGVFLPMYQREAMWIEFNLENKKSPKAIKVAIGKVNALTGETWTNNLNSNGLQDYVVAPLQSWLDGINSGDGKVRQFVAMPLGSGYSVEAQVTGKEEFGGLQLMVLNSREEEKRVVYPVQPPPNISSTTTQVPQTPPLLLQYPQTNPPTLPTKKKGILSWIADLFRPSSEPLTMSIAGIPTGKLRNEFYNHGPIKVAYNGVNHLKSGAWICVYESGQASTDFGMYLERWQYIAGNGEFTIPTNNLREGVLYHFRLFPNGSSYDPVATSEPFTIRHSGLPNTYVTATAPQLPEPEQIECWCEEDQSYDLNDQAYNIVPQSTTTGFSIPNIFRPSHTVNESESVSLARSAVPQPEATRLPAHRRRRPVQEPEAKEMGISTGGSMKQKIVEDPYGLSFWDQDSGARVFVHIVNSEMFKQITGRDPPETTITAQTYTNLGYKWYDVYEEGVNGVAASSVLGNVKSVTQIDSEKYAWPQQDNTSINIQGSQVVTITNPNGVRDGDW